MRFKWSVGFLLLSQFCFFGALLAQRVRVPEGTPLRVRLRTNLMSDQAEEGNRVDFEVARAVVVRGVTVIPAGAQVWGAVQSVKEGKYVRFDIEGVRLPNMAEVKLRCVREKTKKASKDVIKVETDFGNTVGAPRGSEFTAYLDEDVDLEGVPEPAAPAPVARPTPAPVTRAPAPEVTAPPAPSVAPPPTTSAPVTAAPTPAPQAAPAPAPAQSGERITVECFSDPSGADILVDGDFYGSTNSILKISVGTHKLEFQRSGYKTYSQTLQLAAGMMIQTIRVNLEKKP